MAEPTPIRHLDVELETAARLGRVDDVAAMLAEGRAGVVASSLYRACVDGYADIARLPDIARLLLADGRIDPRIHHNLMLRTAAGRGYEEVVAVLLADGRADPAAGDSLVLWESARLLHAEDIATRLVGMFLADGRADPVQVRASYGTAPLLTPATRWWQRRAWLRAGAAVPAAGGKMQ